jgi:hypothetical protein
VALIVIDLRIAEANYDRNHGKSAIPTKKPRLRFTRRLRLFATSCAKETCVRLPERKRFFATLAL